MTNKLPTFGDDLDAHLNTAPLAALLQIMTALRTPESGCPWDLEQDFTSIAPYTIEEAYEVADAIERNNPDDLKSELGDLLCQVVFHSQIAREGNLFDFDDVARAIAAKMVRRHPHVFGNAKERSADEQTKSWEQQKAVERSEKGDIGVLDDVPLSLPGMTRAVKLQKRAARVGFDWTDASDVLAKISEETAELVEASKTGNHDAIEDEFGDLLFVIANLSRHLKIDPEKAVRRTNAKFVRRFQHIEKKLSDQGSSPEEASLDEMEALWLDAKADERH